MWQNFCLPVCLVFVAWWSSTEPAISRLSYSMLRDLLNTNNALAYFVWAFGAVQPFRFARCVCVHTHAHNRRCRAFDLCVRWSPPGRLSCPPFLHHLCLCGSVPRAPSICLFCSFHPFSELPASSLLERLRLRFGGGPACPQHLVACELLALTSPIASTLAIIHFPSHLSHHYVHISIKSRLSNIRLRLCGTQGQARGESCGLSPTFTVRFESLS